MADTREPESGTKKVGDQVVKLTDGISGLVRAGTEAATEVSVGAVRVATEVVSGVAQSVADNLNQAVVGSTEVAQNGVRRLFSLLDSPDEVEKEAGPTATTPRESPKKKD